MTYKDSKSFYFLLVKVFIVLAVFGTGALIYNSLRHDPSEFAFSFIAFIISVAALVMTTLQSISIARQVRVTDRAARLVHESSERLGALVAEDQELEKEIRRDIKLDREIIGILEEHGLGANEAERQAVAARIAKQLHHH